MVVVVVGQQHVGELQLARGAGTRAAARPGRRRRSSPRGRPARRPPRRCWTATGRSSSARRSHRERIGVGCANDEPDPHLLPDHRHRPLGRVLQGAGLRRDRPHPDPRRGDQRVHGPARRRARAAAGADLQRRPQRAVRDRHRVRPHRDHHRRPRRHPGSAWPSRGSSPRGRRTRSATAAAACASCATPTATGSRSSSEAETASDGRHRDDGQAARALRPGRRRPRPREPRSQQLGHRDGRTSTSSASGSRRARRSCPASCSRPTAA